MEDELGTIVIERPLTKEEKTEREAWAAEEPARQRAFVEETRRQAYQRDADPLYFGFQRGDNTEQEWLDAVAKVKADNPYPEVTN